MIQGFQRASRGKTFAVRRPTTSSQWRAMRFIVLGEVAFIVFTGVCVALHPGFVIKGNEGGLSDYGVHLKTVIPYTLALGLLGTLNLRAAVLYSEDDRRSRRFRSLLFAYCGVVLMVLLSTYVYTLNADLKEFHYALGTLLIVVVCAGSLWMSRLRPSSTTVRVFLFVQLTGDVLNVMTAFGELHVLFLAELVSNIGFALILGRTARRIALEDGDTQRLAGSTQ
jgi:uncharacterized membrane protein